MANISYSNIRPHKNPTIDNLDLQDIDGSNFNPWALRHRHLIHLPLQSLCLSLCRVSLPMCLSSQTGEVTNGCFKVGCVGSGSVGEVGYDKRCKAYQEGQVMSEMAR
jgi:hypothetical protein